MKIFSYLLVILVLAGFVQAACVYSNSVTIYAQDYKGESPDDHAIINDRYGNGIADLTQPNDNDVTWNANYAVVVYAGEKLAYTEKNKGNVFIRLLDEDGSKYDTKKFKKTGEELVIQKDGYILFPKGKIATEYNYLKLNICTECSDGRDNDEDGKSDSGDFSCSDEDDDDETYPIAQCQDDLDNDEDGFYDNDPLYYEYATSHRGSNGNDIDCSTKSPGDGYELVTRDCYYYKGGKKTGSVCVLDNCMWRKETDSKIEVTITTEEKKKADCSKTVPTGYTLKDRECLRGADYCKADLCVWEKESTAAYEYDLRTLFTSDDCSDFTPTGYELKDEECFKTDGKCVQKACLFEKKLPEIDLGCTDNQDNDERTECQDGKDNDGDGAGDLSDFSCMGVQDIDESYPKSQCQDGIDNDFDGESDGLDYSCENNQDNDEFYPLAQCQDKIDNDGDDAKDGADFSCSGPQDNDETLPKAQCGDEKDNDVDGASDSEDFSCSDTQDDDETLPKAQCQDELDNDGDGLTDEDDPGCADPQDNDESDGTSECQDGKDNDGDGTTDYDNGAKSDLGCESKIDNDESDGPVTCYTHSECTGSYEKSYCDAGNYMTEAGTAKCHNAGSEQSYCEVGVEKTFVSCTNICSDTLACDYTECSNGKDDDADGTTDYIDDLGCESYKDDDESDGKVECSYDADCGSKEEKSYCDSDYFVEYTKTPVCENPGKESSFCTFKESTVKDECNHICSDTLACDYTECSNGIDDDSDGTVDYNDDLGCSDYEDDDESDGKVECSYDIDCGSDELKSYCSSGDYETYTKSQVCNNAGKESSYCSFTEKTTTDDCSNICSDTQGCDYTECSNIIDDDGDTYVDLDDAGCDDYYDDQEGNVVCSLDSDCGLSSAITSCSDLTYNYEFTSFTCVNPGTYTSTCSSETKLDLFECNYVCDNRFGCDNTECSNGIDDDGDGMTDLDDLGCDSYEDTDEYNLPPVCKLDSECGEDGFATGLTCRGGDVWGKYRTYDCIEAGTLSSYCGYYESWKEAIDCEYGCDDGVCLESKPNNLKETDLYLNRIRFGNLDGSYIDGNQMYFSISLINKGETQLKDVKVTIVFDNGFRMPIAMFNMNKGEQVTKSRLVQLPDYIDGEQTVRVVVSNDEIRRVVHRDVVISY